MRDTAFFLLILGFTGGVGIGTFLNLSWVLLVSATVISILLCFLCTKYRRIAAVLFLIAGVCAGLLRVEMEPAGLDPVIAVLVDSGITFEGKIIAEPDRRETSQRVIVATKIEEETHQVLVVADAFPVLYYSDVIRVTGKLTKPKPFETDTARVFAYDKFLAKDRVFLMVSKAEVEKIGTVDTVPTRSWRLLLSIKNKFLQVLGEVLPEPQSSLAGGLIAGGKQGLGDDLMKAFTISGLIHIVVLSGYNVMIIAESILKFSGVLGKRISLLLSGVIIVLFVLAAGAGPASIRAGIMAVLTIVARMTGRTYDVARALLFAGVLMMLHSPYILVYDPGFQLSFLATLGLMYGCPITETWMRWIGNSVIKDVAATTVAAQIAVLPLLLYQSGILSFVAFPVNLLVLPAVPITMGLVFVTGIFSLVLPGVGAVFGYVPYLLLSYIIWIAEEAASIPYAYIQLPPFSFLFVIFAYAAMIGWIWKSRRRTSGFSANSV